MCILPSLSLLLLHQKFWPKPITRDENLMNILDHHCYRTLVRGTRLRISDWAPFCAGCYEAHFCSSEEFSELIKSHYLVHKSEIFDICCRHCGRNLFVIREALNCLYCVHRHYLNYIGKEEEIPIRTL